MKKIIFFIGFILYLYGYSYAANVELTAGTGISVVNNGVTATVSGTDATTTTKGILSVDSTDFSISSGSLSLGANPSISGTLAGNSSTASALASNPTDCSSNLLAYAIDSSGNLSCVSVGPTYMSNGDFGDFSCNGTTCVVDNDSLALGTKTTGNYVSSATSNQGLTLTGTEGASLGIQDCSSNQIIKRNATDDAWECAADSGTSTPENASYITSTSDGTLTNEFALSTLSSGILRVETSTGSLSSLTTSAGVSANISDETGSGSLVFGTSPSFSTSISIPNGSNPTVDAAGEIAIDTTDDQIVYYGTAKRVVPYTLTRCGYFADLTDADDNISLGMFGDGVTITGVGCSYNGTGSTPATITLEDGAGNAMTITGTNPTCVANGTTSTFSAVTANNQLTAGEISRFDVTNTPSPTTDDYTICITYTFDAQ